MGGKAFKDAVRINSKEEYQNLFNKQKEMFNHITNDLYLPRQLTSKTSFGDLDIILSKDCIDQVAEKLESLDYPLLIIRNKITEEITYNVISYLYDNKYQVDLIFIDNSFINYAIDYFSFGDQGNISGMLLRKYSVKNSFTGLYFVYRQDNGNYKRDILIFDEYRDYLKLLDLDVQKFDEGFNTQEEVFEWITSSSFFESNIYELKKLNSKRRARDSKREYYTNFLKYLSDKDLPYESNKFLKLDMEDFKQRYVECDLEYEELKQFKNKFNGFLVTNLRKLEGEPLGKFMNNFRKEYSKKDILNFTDEELEQKILNYNF